MVDHNATASLVANVLFPIIQGPNDWPDYWENRFMYEDDGTTVKYYRAPSGGEYVEYAMSYTDVSLMNGVVGRWPHDDPYESYQYHFIFPELRNVDYVFLSSMLDGSVGGDPYWKLYWSNDTTNGEDGTWTQVAVNTTAWSGMTYDRLRKSLFSNPLFLTNVRGLKLKVDHTLAWPWGDGGGRPHLIHIYGDRGVGNRLAFWHPTRDEEIDTMYFDWGSFSYEEGYRTVPFRVKNMSPTKRALNNRLYFGTNSRLNSAYFLPLHSFSYQGVNFLSSVDLPMLASGEISEEITLRMDTSKSAPPLAFDVKLMCSTQTWQTYIHNTSSSFLGWMSSEIAPQRTQNAQASITTIAYVTDGSLYTGDRTYREQWPYTGSTTTQYHAGAAAISTDATPDLYTDEYLNAGVTNLTATVWVNPAATSAITASAVSDLYADSYSNEYGTSGLFAVATVV